MRVPVFPPCPPLPCATFSRRARSPAPPSPFPPPPPKNRGYSQPCAGARLCTHSSTNILFHKYSSTVHPPFLPVCVSPPPPSTHHTHRLPHLLPTLSFPFVLLPPRRFPPSLSAFGLPAAYQDFSWPPRAPERPLPLSHTLSITLTLTPSHSRSHPLSRHSIQTASLPPSLRNANPPQHRPPRQHSRPPRHSLSHPHTGTGTCTANVLGL